ncbi:MAG: hypothetical protein WBB94_03405 [Candidatus Saccharimonadaceae bacterium]
MKIYQSKIGKIPGRNYSDIERAARRIHIDIARQTKRSPYVKSEYFGKSKVFIDMFWSHLNQKPRSDRKRRLKYYAAAIDLLNNSRIEPTRKPNPNGKQEIVYRFYGVTKDSELFCVQVKQDSKGNKYFMSVFSPK